MLFVLTYNYIHEYNNVNKDENINSFFKFLSRKFTTQYTIKPCTCNNIKK